MSFFHEVTLGDVVIFEYTLDVPEVYWSADWSLMAVLESSRISGEDPGFAVRLNPLTCCKTLGWISESQVPHL